MNLNDQNGERLKAQLRELLAAHADVVNHVVWVDDKGEVRIDPLPNGITPAIFAEAEPRLRFRLETLAAGSSYVGKGAAEDDLWVDDLLEQLLAAWTSGARGYVDFF